MKRHTLRLTIIFLYISLSAHAAMNPSAKKLANIEAAKKVAESSAGQKAGGRISESKGEVTKTARASDPIHDQH